MPAISLLYVDDDKHLLDVCKMYLEQMGSMKVDTALSAKNALDKLVTTHYDAIVSDYEMPEMNGIDFLKAVRKSYGYLPFIIFTGKGREEIVIEAINSGADFYLQKGGDPDAQFAELSHKIRQAVKSYKADVSLKDSEEKFHQIFNSVNDAIHIHEIDKEGLPGKFTDVNEVACRMLQYKRSDLLKIMPLDLTTEYSSIPVEEIEKKLTSTGQVIFETFYIRNDGQTIPVEINAHVTVLKGKKVVISVVRDLSERIREEKILRTELDLGKDLQKIRNLPEMLETCLSFAIDASGLDAGGVYLVDDITGSLDLIVSRNLGPEFLSSFTKNPAGTQFAQMATTVKSQYFPPDLETPIHKELCKKENLLLFALIPVIVKGHPVACLFVTSHTANEVSEHSRIVLETIATLIGISIEKVRDDETTKSNLVRLETAMEIGNLAWWEMELPQGTIRFDERKAKILRYSPEKFVHYSDFTALLHPNDYEQTMQAMRDHLEGKVSRYYADYRIQDADGNYHWFRDVGGITQSHADGTPKIVSGVVIDLTTSKKLEVELTQKHEELLASFEQLTATEEELHQNYDELEKGYKKLARSEQEFRNLFENIVEGLAVHELVRDANGQVSEYRILSVNPSFERIIGINATKVIGKISCEAYGTDKPPFLEIYTRVAETGKPEVFETYFPPMDKYFRISVYSPGKNQFVTVFSDISKEKRNEEALIQKNTDLEAAYEELTATEEEIRSNLDELTASQQELRKSEEQYRRIVDTANEGIWELDAEFHIIFFNPRMSEILGYSSEEMMGRRITDFVPPKEVSAYEHHLKDRRYGHDGHYEQNFVRKDGSIVILYVSATPVVSKRGAFLGSFAMFSDITERKRAENELKQKNTDLEAAYEELTATEEEIRHNLEELAANEIKLRRSEAHLEAAQKLAQMGSWEFDISSGKISWTAETFRIFNVEPSQGEPTFEELIRYWHPDDLEPFLSAVNDAQEHGVPYDLENRILLPDGTPKYIRAQGQAEKRKGKIGKLWGTIQDITSIKKAEEALRESEERYRNVVESQTEFISRFLPDATHVFVNEAYCRYFGLSRDQIIGHRFRPQIPAADQERMKRFFESLTQEHPVDTIEHRIVMPDGSIRWQRWNDRAIFDPNGNVIEYQSVGRDITETKEAEAALQESEHRFREQYQNNPLAICTWQHQKGDFVLVDCNPAAQNLTNGRSNELIGRTASELYAKRPEILSVIRQCISEKKVITKELVSENFLPGRLISSTASPVPPDKIMVHIQDITDRERAESAIRQANRQLNLLTSITRHDILNNISAIQAYLIIAKKKEPSPEVSTIIDKIGTTTATMKNQIEFTRVYKDLGTHDPQWQDIGTITTRLSPPPTLAINNGITGLEIYADPMLEKVFSNLLDNTIRHAEKATEVALSCRKLADDIIILWEDNGVGIPKDEKEDIFARGYGKNTGFGLYLVREILAITGISIKETGEPGKGARFEINVPNGAWRTAGTQL